MTIFRLPRLSDLLTAIEERLAGPEGECTMTFDRFPDEEGHIAYRFTVKAPNFHFETIAGSKEAAAHRCWLILTGDEALVTSALTE